MHECPNCTSGNFREGLELFRGRDRIEIAYDCLDCAAGWTAVYEYAFDEDVTVEEVNDG